MTTSATLISNPEHFLLGIGHNLPLHTLAWLIRRPRRFSKGFVQRQIVPDGILQVGQYWDRQLCHHSGPYLPTSRWLVSVIRIVISDILINPRKVQLVLLSCHDGLCDHLCVAEVWFDVLVFVLAQVYVVLVRDKGARGAISRRLIVDSSRATLGRRGCPRSFIIRWRRSNGLLEMATPGGGWSRSVVRGQL